ncbi:MAG: hypothetical protein WAM58_21980 [Candidatus Acidiferrum sp.]
MKHVWRIVNVGLIMSSLWGGYNSMTPEKLRHTNPDVYACIAILVVMPFFALGCVGYSIRRWKRDPLSRPSWDRNPMSWWFDPLQSLFVFTCVMAATAIGSALRHPALGSVGFWTVGVYCSFVIGLLLGQILAYRIYREHITAAHS